jgi:hypothetical protein
MLFAIDADEQRKVPAAPPLDSTPQPN